MSNVLSEIAGLVEAKARLKEAENGSDGTDWRKVFAGMAMQGQCASSNPHLPTDIQSLAENSVRIADALIAALNKEPDDAKD